MKDIEEFDRLLSAIGSSQLGILLDVGHLKLSAIANQFNPMDFIREFRPRIRACHVHENNGKKDSHLPLTLQSDLWPWLESINSQDLLITFEGRNLPMSDVLNSVTLLNDRFAGQKTRE